MTRQEMLYLLRLQLSDEQNVGWPDDIELLAYLDRAANFYSEQLIAAKDPTLMKRLNVAGQSQVPLPDDFVAFAGTVPILIIGRVCEIYCELPTDVLYWGRFPAPSSFLNILPYTHEQALIIIDIARIFAINKNEYDLTHDLTLLEQLKNVIFAARAPQSGG